MTAAIAMTTIPNRKTRIVLEYITPQLATTYLQLNVSNRPLMPHYISMLAREMKTRAWKVNGETIKFGVSGGVTYLLDGQHRLSACNEANVPFYSYVVWDLEDSVFDTIDTGKKRTIGDVLFVAKQDNPKTLGATLALVWRYRQHSIGVRSSNPSNTDRLELLKENPAVHQSVCYAVDHRTPFLSMPIVAFLHWLGSRVDAAKTEQFLSSVVSGANLEVGSPALALRNYGSAIEQVGGRLDRDRIIIAATKGLRAHLQGLQIRMLRVGRGEVMPTIE